MKGEPIRHVLYVTLIYRKDRKEGHGVCRQAGKGSNPEWNRVHSEHGLGPGTYCSTYSRQVRDKCA